MGANPQLSVDLFTFPMEIFYGQLHFLCSVFSTLIHSAITLGRQIFTKMQFREKGPQKINKE